MISDDDNDNHQDGGIEAPSSCPHIKSIIRQLAVNKTSSGSHFRNVSNTVEQKLQSIAAGGGGRLHFACISPAGKLVLLRAQQGFPS